MLRYKVDKSGVVSLIKDIDSIVDLLISEDWVLDLLDGNVEDAREQIRFLCIESNLNYNDIVEYLRVLHNRKKN